MNITKEEIGLIRAKMSRELGFYDHDGKVRFETFHFIQKELLSTSATAVVGKGALEASVLLAEIKKKTDGRCIELDNWKSFPNNGEEKRFTRYVEYDLMLELIKFYSK